MALDKLVGMTVFRRAVELGSLTASARASELSPEMAGQHLKALERRLGVRLLKRTTRRLSLTDVGRAYYDRCIAALDEIALAEAEAGSRQADPGGRPRIAAPLAFGTTLLAPAIDAFLDRHPGVSVEVDLSERSVDLLTENVDLALRLGEPAPSGLIAWRLASFPLILVASPAYLSNHPAPGRPRDLAAHQALIYTQTHAPARWSFTGPDGMGRRRHRQAHPGLGRGFSPGPCPDRPRHPAGPIIRSRGEPGDRAPRSRLAGMAGAIPAPPRPLATSNVDAGHGAGLSRLPG